VGSRSISGAAALAVLLIGFTVTSGCAGRNVRRQSAAAQAGRAAASSGNPLTLAWLPVEGFVTPAVAAALDRHLEAAPIPDLGRKTRAPVSMEVAQLTLECIEAEPRCYRLVGEHLRVNRLLWAELTAPDKRGAPLRATVFLFDVDRATEVSRAERVFAGPEAAVAGFAALVAQAVAVRGGGSVARAPGAGSR
jgi:hypothetical protein